MKSLEIRLEEFLDSVPAETNLLPAHELHGFVGHLFDERGRYLQAIEENPSPIYLLDPEVLKTRARQIREAFQRVFSDASFFYALKSNNHPAVAETLLECGLGLDVSSGEELQIALDLGARNILFSGPGKTPRELELAADHWNRVTVNLDSFGELRRLEGIAGSTNRRMRCGIRLCVNPDGLWRKFGIPLSSLEEFWREASACEHIELMGLQFHTSWNLSPHAQVDFMKTLGRTLAGMPESYKSSVEFVDIGGGYWPAQGEWLQSAGTRKGRLCCALEFPCISPATHYRMPATPIEAYAEEIGRAFQKYLAPSVRPRVFLEPGRWICNDAVHLLVSVIDKKAPDLVITDAGTNAVGWERFETDYFPILNLTRPAMVERPCHVLGSLCTPHDVWGYAYFGEDILPGDILLIPAQGAYTYSLRQNFIKPLPVFHSL